MWSNLAELIRDLGINGKVIVSAELGLNHNGDTDLAKKMIGAAGLCGCQAVKVQNYRTGDVVKSRREMITVDGKDYNAWDLFSRCELDLSQLKALKAHSDACGLIFHSTPTSREGALELRQIGGNIVKIASDMMLDPAFASSCGVWFQNNVVASMGCTEMWVGTNSLLHWVWLHCVRKYPTPVSEARLERIGSLRAGGRKLVGYFDHTEGIEAAVSAVRDFGAVWVEKHFTFDHSLPGPDHKWSADPREMKELVTCLKSV